MLNTTLKMENGDDNFSVYAVYLVFRGVVKTTKQLRSCIYLTGFTKFWNE